MQRGLFEELESLTERYLTSDIAGALAALVETEALLRARPPTSSWRFALAIVLAMKSEILLQLGNPVAASLLTDEAVQLFQETDLGIKAGLVTPEAVQRFVREKDAQSKVKWRQP